MVPGVLGLPDERDCDWIAGIVADAAEKSPDRQRDRIFHRVHKHLVRARSAIVHFHRGQERRLFRSQPCRVGVQAIIGWIGIPRHRHQQVRAGKERQGGAGQDVEVGRLWDAARILQRELHRVRGRCQADRQQAAGQDSGRPEHTTVVFRVRLNLNNCG